MMYSKITDRAKATRVKDFNIMIERDMIVRLGEGRGTYYKMKESYENTNYTITYK